WDAEGLALLRDRLLRETTPGQRGHHAIAGLEARDAGPTARHHARRLQSRAEGERWPRLILPRHHEGIRIVDGRDAHIDEALLGGRCGSRHVLDGEVLHGSPGPTDHGTHRAPPTEVGYGAAV